MDRGRGREGWSSLRRRGPAAPLHVKVGGLMLVLWPLWAALALVLLFTLVVLLALGVDSGCEPVDFVRVAC